MFHLRVIRYVAHQASKQIEKKYANSLHQHRLTLNNVSISNLTSNAKSLSHAPDTIKQETEEEFLVRLKRDPDVFGNSLEKEVCYEKDLEDERRFEERTLPSQKLRTKQYADIIKDLIKKRKIKEAIDVVEVKMLKEDQVKPENYIFNLLLGACGRVGYTKKAFSLYNQMKKRGLKATGGTYTALFNACANSPWPEDGLSRAQHLRNIMIEKMYEPNATNYNAMIKAFGRCGDLATSFSLVDEMAAKKIAIKDDTMNFLIQACIQDREAGFRHALLVWRKIVEKNIIPSSYTYNLMLRCIRDCGIGDVEVTQQLLDTTLKQDDLKLGSNDNKLLFGPPYNEKPLIQNQLDIYKHNSPSIIHEVPNEKSNNIMEASSLSIDDICRPNLMAKVPHLGNIISLSEITKAEDRLLLVGGLKGFLSNMAENKCVPDIKTFTQLLNILPGSKAAEKELQSMMKKLNVKPDIDFFNMLIKKRSMRFDYESAKTVLDEMSKFQYKPNVLTYGVLALGCKTKGEALELLNEMQEHSYRLNTEILGAMLHQACHHGNFPYVLELMEISLKENVKPNKIFLQCLQDFKKKCKAISNDTDNKVSESASFQKGWKIFQMRYKTWLEEIAVDDTAEAHPWTQYRQTTATDVRHYKDKAHRFKPRHTSRFKVKTSLKHK